MIASGDVVDFAGEAEWPRFTMNATPISFDNDVAYAHYQLIFTAIRGPVGGGVNSMQIAEVELLGVLGPAGPIGHWKLDEGEGAVAVDSSGQGNDGTIHNADAGGLGDGGSVWVDDPERGMVISFNGDDSGAYVSTDLIIPFMSLNNDFTWAFWAKQHADQETNNDLILGNRFGGTEAPLQFIKFTPTRFEFFNDDYDYLEGVNYEPVPGDVWVHHVTVKDGTSLTYYRNGEEAGTNTITKTIDENPFSMGGDATNVTEMWRGYLSDVRIYDRALSADEISELAGAISDTVENLLQNPSFEEDEPILDDPDWVSWCTWNPDQGAGSNTTIVDTEAIDGTRSLRIEPKGTENWHFILVNISFAADLDKNYTASFWAKAEAPRPLTVQMKASDNSVDAWGATDFDLTTEWAEYTYTSEVLHHDVKLEFLCSSSEVPFWLDLVSVYEAD